MAIIGFMFLVVLGLYFVVIAVQLFGAALVGFDGAGKLALVPAAIAGFIFWLAFHFAPFSITIN